MSRETAEAFIEKLGSDEAFRGGMMAVKEVAARRQFIGSEGFDCPAEEVGAASDAQAAAADGLSGDGLTGVVGRPKEPVEDEPFLPGRHIAGQKAREWRVSDERGRDVDRRPARPRSAAGIGAGRRASGR